MTSSERQERALLTLLADLQDRLLAADELIALDTDRICELEAERETLLKEAETAQTLLDGYRANLAEYERQLRLRGAEVSRG